MRLSLTVVNALVAAAVAAPSPAPRSTLKARHARRTALRHGEFRDSPASLFSSSGSLGLLDSLLSAAKPDESESASDEDSTASHSAATSQKAASNVDYNESWAGSVVTGTGMTGVSGSFVVPEPKIPTNGNQVSAQEHVVSAWIGMDGYNCEGGLWQAGVDAGINAQGTYYYAWYEWYPSATVEIDLGGVTAGDTITINMTSGGDYKTGQITITNSRTGVTYTNTVSDSEALCSTAIDWIVEDLVVDSTTYGLANFGSVTFSDVQGTSTSGSVSLSGVHMLDIQDSDGTQLTSSSTTDNSVVVTYLS
ncbi:hypothetical protein E8E14_004835 [Neopestalotiopsis sp. 37M]|nr:hypothetical protein E8E14_004835 [Neopestalotiopsis sp. 37M]